MSEVISSKNVFVLQSGHPHAFKRGLFFSPEQPRQTLIRTMMPLNLVGFRLGLFYSWPYRANFILLFCFSSSCSCASSSFIFHFLSEPVFDFSSLCRVFLIFSWAITPRAWLFLSLKLFKILRSFPFRRCIPPPIFFRIKSIFKIMLFNIYFT